MTMWGEESTATLWMSSGMSPILRRSVTIVAGHELTNRSVALDKSSVFFARWRHACMSKVQQQSTCHRRLCGLGRPQQAVVSPDKFMDRGGPQQGVRHAMQGPRASQR